MKGHSKSLTSKAKVKGWVERRLFDGKKLKVVKYAMELGLSKKDIEFLENWAAKPQFKENFLWRIIKKIFNIDLQIPFITGYWTKAAIIRNTIPDRGKQKIAELTGGTDTTPVSAIALGIGTPTATALGNEVVRAAATVSNTTTTTTGDTEQWTHTFNFTASYGITEEGLFDNNVSGGVMLASQSFAVVNVQNGDAMQITHKVQIQ